MSIYNDTLVCDFVCKSNNFDEKYFCSHLGLNPGLLLYVSHGAAVSAFDLNQETFESR